MSKKHQGVQAHIRQLFPEAVYVHCKSHCLNLAIGHSCKDASVRTLMGTIQDTAFAFDYSAKKITGFLRSASRRWHYKRCTWRPQEIVYFVRDMLDQPCRLLVHFLCVISCCCTGFRTTTTRWRRKIRTVPCHYFKIHIYYRACSSGTHFKIKRVKLLLIS